MAGTLGARWAASAAREGVAPSLGWSHASPHLAPNVGGRLGGNRPNINGLWPSCVARTRGVGRGSLRGGIRDVGHGSPTPEDAFTPRPGECHDAPPRERRAGTSDRRPARHTEAAGRRAPAPPHAATPPG